MPEDDPLTAQPRPFVTERVKRRWHPHRAPERQASTVPSSADCLRSIAQELGNVPREATESREDMFHFLRRKKGQLLVLAERVERAEDRRGERPGPAVTKTAPKTAPVTVRPAREAFYGRRKARVVPHEQLDLLTC